MRRWSVPRRTQPSSGLSARRGPPGSQKRRLMDSPGAASAYPSSGEGQFIFSQPAPDQDLQTRPADGPTDRRRKSENSEMLGRGGKTGNRETDCESPSLTMLLNAAGTCRLPCEESPVGSECVAGHVDRRECRTSLLRLIRPTRLGGHSGPRKSGRSAAGPACYPAAGRSLLALAIVDVVRGSHRHRGGAPRQRREARHHHRGTPRVGAQPERVKLVTEMSSSRPPFDSSSSRSVK